MVLHNLTKKNPKKLFKELELTIDCRCIYKKQKIKNEIPNESPKFTKAVRRANINKPYNMSLH